MLKPYFPNSCNQFIVTVHPVFLGIIPFCPYPAHIIFNYIFSTYRQGLIYFVYTSSRHVQCRYVTVGTAHFTSSSVMQHHLASLRNLPGF
jgi:hypothetical protein